MDRQPRLRLVAHFTEVRRHRKRVVRGRKIETIRPDPADGVRRVQRHGNEHRVVRLVLLQHRVRSVQRHLEEVLPIGHAGHVDPLPVVDRAVNVRLPDVNTLEKPAAGRRLTRKSEVRKRRAARRRSRHDEATANVDQAKSHLVSNRRRPVRTHRDRPRLAVDTREQPVVRVPLVVKVPVTLVPNKLRRQAAAVGHKSVPRPRVNRLRHVLRTVGVHVVRPRRQNDRPVSHVPHRRRKPQQVPPRLLSFVNVRLEIPIPQQWHHVRQCVHQCIGPQSAGNSSQWRKLHLLRPIVRDEVRVDLSLPLRRKLVEIAQLDVFRKVHRRPVRIPLHPRAHQSPLMRPPAQHPPQFQALNPRRRQHKRSTPNLRLTHLKPLR